MLVDCSPEVGRFALNDQEDFINVPFISRLRTSAT